MQYKYIDFLEKFFIIVLKSSRQLSLHYSKIEGVEHYQNKMTIHLKGYDSCHKEYEDSANLIADRTQLMSKGKADVKA